MLSICGLTVSTLLVVFWLLCSSFILFCCFLSLALQFDYFYFFCSGMPWFLFLYFLKYLVGFCLVVSMILTKKKKLTVITVYFKLITSNAEQSTTCLHVPSNFKVLVSYLYCISINKFYYSYFSPFVFWSSYQYYI